MAAPSRGRVTLLLLALCLAWRSSPAPTRASLRRCRTAGQTQIACENALPGSPRSEWDITGAGDDSIQGYATPFSLDHGQTVSFKVKTDASAYRIDIYRLGYYGGLGARKVATVAPSAALPQNQPACLSRSGHRPRRLRQLGRVGVVDGAGDRGLRRLHRASSCGPTPAAASHIFFVVRDDEQPLRRSCSRRRTRPGRPTTATAATASTSATAGGSAYKVSYNRPFTTRARRTSQLAASAPNTR